MRKYILWDTEICHILSEICRLRLGNMSYKTDIFPNVERQKEESKRRMSEKFDILLFQIDILLFDSSFSMCSNEKEQYSEQYQRKFDIVPNIVLNIVLFDIKGIVTAAEIYKLLILAEIFSFSFNFFAVNGKKIK